MLSAVVAAARSRWSTTGNNMDRLADANAEDEFYVHNTQLSNNDSFDKEVDVVVEDRVDTFDSYRNESEHKEEGAGGKVAKEDGRSRGKKDIVAVPKGDNAGLTLRLTRAGLLDQRRLSSFL